jgi:MFS family permease
LSVSDDIIGPVTSTTFTDGSIVPATERSPGRNPSFLLLWVGQAVSEIGSAVTGLVIPLFAVATLDASTVEVGVLKSCATVAVLFTSIPAGVFIDRHAKRPVMIICDAGRALALASIPVMALVGSVTMVQLYIVSVATGVLTFIFGVAYHAYYPSIVQRGDLGEANSKIASTEAFARVSGPGIGALLFSLFRAPAAILVDVATFLVSVVTLALIRTPEERVAPDPTAKRTPMRREMRDGVRLVFADRVLSSTAVTTIASVFCLCMTDAVFVYFLIHSLHMATGIVGVVYAVGEVGGLVAAILARRIMRAIGTGRIMWIAVLASPAGFLAAVATPGSAIVMTSLFMIFSSTRFVLFDVAQYSYRQTVSPADSLGKVTSTIRLAIGIAAAAGALIGGWLGDVIGARETIALAIALTCVAAVPVLVSPLRHVRDIDELPAVQDIAAREVADPETFRAAGDLDSGTADAIEGGAATADDISAEAVQQP